MATREEEQAECDREQETERWDDIVASLDRIATAIENAVEKLGHIEDSLDLIRGHMK